MRSDASENRTCSVLPNVSYVEIKTTNPNIGYRDRQWKGNLRVAYFGHKV